MKSEYTLIGVERSNGGTDKVVVKMTREDVPDEVELAAGKEREVHNLEDAAVLSQMGGNYNLAALLATVRAITRQTAIDDWSVRSESYSVDNPAAFSPGECDLFAPCMEQVGAEKQRVSAMSIVATPRGIFSGNWTGEVADPMYAYAQVYLQIVVQYKEAA